MDGSHTELMRAALEGKSVIVKALLDRGADVNARDSEGRTALMFAAVNMQHPDTATALLEHGADVNATAEDGCHVRDKSRSSVLPETKQIGTLAHNSRRSL